ncbi:MAG TPA: hypothetical protein VHZ78_01725 [Rhizomicrobium sp.]|jgi:hypothetical protein|nr:hypothetical protein [Rhizomicrobium sp.]
MTAPDTAMLAPVHKIARFIAGGGDENLSAFADRDVAILENFAPYLFTGPDAVTRWAAGMRAHAQTLSDMQHSFGAAQDFARDGDIAYFSLPTHWRGASNGVAFAEDGGWAFVLIRKNGEWRVRNYGWSVTNLVRL